MRTDPTENGGLFLGRRPGTAPLRYAALPDPGSTARRRIDRLIAAAMLLAMVLLTALVWGPLPMAAMWIASQLSSENVGLWILIAFVLVLAFVFGALILLRRVDQAWILVRRAGGHDQRNGVLSRVFAATTFVVVPGFSIWFLFLGGLLPTVGGL
ncbi:hypothetical protein PAI11_32420 [Patulibacter medicamentivorans]|uniref:Uncharacterized protein n=1 Tax=Patulibacter medicamentivorans TaxID=1097667 RepID=H0E8S8_9ACTN|nr:hypothetical protein [Patulibacter medicamentivorans]EHN09956.1 hypothetical protein PAI11_32420 [Patulibacter medicamentivorans]